MGVKKEEKPVYICLDHNGGQSGYGSTLDEAFENYRHEGGDYEFTYLSFYSAVEIQVEQKIVERTTIEKV